MTTSDTVPYLTPKFDDFLFARINTNSDEMPLSVLSVLARLGIDPWEEAGRLAQLPRLAAAKRLASMIASMPGPLPAHLDAATICERLITLLPAPPAVTRLPRFEHRAQSLTKSPFTGWVLIAAFLLAIQLVVMSRQSATQDNGPQAPVTSTASPK